MNRLLVTCSVLSLVLAAQSAYAGSFRDAYLQDQSIRAGRPSPGKVKSVFQNLGEKGTPLFGGKAQSPKPNAAPSAAPRVSPAPSTPPNAAPAPATPKAKPSAKPAPAVAEARPAPATATPTPPPAPPPPPAAPVTPKPSVTSPKTGGSSSAPPASPSIADQIQGGEARGALRKTPAPVEKKGRSFLDDIAQKNPKGNLRSGQAAQERADAIAARHAPKLANRVEDPDKTNYLPRGATAEQHYDSLKKTVSPKGESTPYKLQELSPVELSLLSLYDMAYGDGALSEAIAKRLDKSVMGEPIKKPVKSGKTGIDALDQIRAAVAADADDDDNATNLTTESPQPVDDALIPLQTQVERLQSLWSHFNSSIEQANQYLTSKDAEGVRDTLVAIRAKLNKQGMNTITDLREAISSLDSQISALKQPKRPESDESESTLSTTSTQFADDIRAWGTENGISLLRLKNVTNSIKKIKFDALKNSETLIKDQIRLEATKDGLTTEQVESLMRYLSTTNSRETRFITYPLVEVESTKTKWVGGKRELVVERKILPQQNEARGGFSPLEKLALALDQERPYAESLAKYEQEHETLDVRRAKLREDQATFADNLNQVLSPLDAIIAQIQPPKASEKNASPAADAPKANETTVAPAADAPSKKPGFNMGLLEQARQQASDNNTSEDDDDDWGEDDGWD